MIHKLIYSIYILIILLIMFWFVCDCINQYNDYTIHKEHMTNNNNNNNFIYGGSKINIGSDSVYPYISYKKGVIIIPNSKSAMRRLMSTELYKCS